MVRLGSKTKAALILFAAATAVYAVGTRQSHGRFMGVPFDWRVPDFATVRKRVWNASDDRLFSPTIFGIGWTLNVHQALVRLGWIEPEDDRLD